MPYPVSATWSGSRLPSIGHLRPILQHRVTEEINNSLVIGQPGSGRYSFADIWTRYAYFGTEGRDKLWGEIPGHYNMKPHPDLPHVVSTSAILTTINCKALPHSEIQSLNQIIKTLARDGTGLLYRNGDIKQSAQEGFNMSTMDHRFADTSETDGISDVSIARAVREEYKTKMPKYRTFLFKDANRLPPAAFNALRRIIEMYENTSRYIFITTDLTVIPPAIQSRCQRVWVQSPDLGDIKHLMKSFLSRLIAGGMKTFVSDYVSDYNSYGPVYVKMANNVIDSAADLCELDTSKPLCELTAAEGEARRGKCILGVEARHINEVHTPAIYGSIEEGADQFSWPSRLFKDCMFLCRELMCVTDELDECNNDKLLKHIRQNRCDEEIDENDEDLSIADEKRFFESGLGYWKLPTSTTNTSLKSVKIENSALRQVLLERGVDTKQVNAYFKVGVQTNDDNDVAGPVSTDAPFMQKPLSSMLTLQSLRSLYMECYGISEDYHYSHWASNSAVPPCDFQALCAIRLLYNLLKSESDFTSYFLPMLVKLNYNMSHILLMLQQRWVYIIDMMLKKMPPIDQSVAMPSHVPDLDANEQFFLANLDSLIKATLTPVSNDPNRDLPYLSAVESRSSLYNQAADLVWRTIGLDKIPAIRKLIIEVLASGESPYAFIQSVQRIIYSAIMLNVKRCATNNIAGLPLIFKQTEVPLAEVRWYLTDRLNQICIDAENALSAGASQHIALEKWAAHVMLLREEMHTGQPVVYTFDRSATGMSIQ